jgi:hypothetical protein
VRSYRLRPGERTFIAVNFVTTIDGPGQHGESIDVMTVPPHSKRRALGTHDFWVLIVVR